MAINNVRTALQLLSGAGELTRAKALEAAGTLLDLPGVGETSARAGQLAEELIEAASANQAMITDLVRNEVDGRLAFLGLARSSDLEAAQRKIEALEREVAGLRESVGGSAGSPGGDGPGATAKVSRSAIKRSAKPATPAKSAASAGPAARSAKAAKKTTAKKTTAKKTTAKKATAKKATPAKKTTKKTASQATTSAATKKASGRTS